MANMKSRYEPGVVLSFDLVVEWLRIYYSDRSPENAYREIKNHLSKHGFLHLKDSDYLHETMTLKKATDLMRTFAADHLWFAPSLAKLNISPKVRALDISHDIRQIYIDEEWAQRKEQEHRNRDKKRERDGAWER